MNKYTEERPWGKFEKYVENQACTVKLHFISPDQEWSLQYHEKRDEFLKIIQGQAEVIIDEETKQAREDDEFFIPRGTKHRIKASNELVKVLEISLGQFEEGDIVRLEDEYGRE